MAMSVMWPLRAELRTNRERAGTVERKTALATDVGLWTYGRFLLLPLVLSIDPNWAVRR